MKICFVSRELPSSPRCGGIGHYVWDCALSLIDCGHSVVIISASDSNTLQIENKGNLKIVRLPNIDFYPYNFSKCKTVYSKIRNYLFYYKYRSNVSNFLNILIKEDGIQIVEFPEYGAEGLLWCGVKRNIPMIVRFHGPTILDRKTGGPIKFILNPLKYVFSKLELIPILKANAISSASETMTSFFINNTGISLNNCQVIYNAIRGSDWFSIENRRYTEHNNRIRIFSAGTFVESKGFVDLIDACKVLINHGYNIELTIAGKLNGFSKKIIEKNKELSWLNIIGPIARNELKRHYSESDICCFPSWWEPFGLVCIEAMATGAVVLGSKAGGMNEIITDGYDGFIIAPKNVKLLASKLEEIIKLNSDVVNSIRKNARKTVKSKFDHHVILKQQIEFYNKVISGFESKNKKYI